MAIIVARWLRRSFHDPGTTIDFYFAGLLLVIGFYFLQPIWMSFRYPAIAKEMEGIGPVWAWGAFMAMLGLVMIAAMVWRCSGVLAGCYIVSFGLWLMISWIFCFGVAVPPIEAVTAPLCGVLAAVRASQLPQEGRCGD